MPSSRASIVAVLLVGTFLSSLDVTVVGTVMPRIVGELQGMTLYGWVFSAYLLASTAAVPIYGKLADLIGRKRAYLIGLALFVAGSVLCGAATSMPLLVAARLVQGAGGGALFPVTQTILGDLFAVEERARVQGLFALAWGVSSVVGPAAGGAFVAFASWRWVFLINLPLGVVTGLVLAARYQERVEPERPPMDVAGAVLLVAWLSLLLVGLGRDRPNPGLLGVALLLGAVLVAVERRAAAPILPRDLFEDRLFAIACAANLLLGAVLFAFIAYVPLYLQAVIGLSPFAAGMLGVPVSLGWTAMSFVGGRSILAHGYRIVLRLGAGVVGLAALATAGAAASRGTPVLGWALFEVGQLTLGAGMGLASTALIIVVQERVPWSRRGAVTATLQLTRQLGMTVGTAALGVLLVALFTRSVAGLGIDPDAALRPGQVGGLPGPAREGLAAALGWVTWVVVVLALVGSVVALAFPDVRAEKDRNVITITANVSKNDALWSHEILRPSSPPVAAQ